MHSSQTPGFEGVARRTFQRCQSLATGPARIARTGVSTDGGALSSASMSPRGMALSAATRSDDVEVLTYLTVGAQSRRATLQHNEVCRLSAIGLSPSSCLIVSATMAVACP